VSVVSIFVNPTQFAPGEDFAEYPRTPEADLMQCEDAGVDIVFFPENDQLYLEDHSTEILVHKLTERYCGAARPGHFAGVTLVVAKLLNIVQPDIAYFGQKDYQQFRVIERMVRDLDFPVVLAMCATVRESDGLAMSSRNAYLSEDEREAAATIYKGLQALAESFAAGERDYASLKKAARAELAEPVRLEYLEIADAWSLEPKQSAARGDVVLVAAHVGDTRLIDNIVLAAGEENAN
jgi:pantoate--beta-alanine ligase